MSDQTDILSAYICGPYKLNGLDYNNEYTVRQKSFPVTVHYTFCLFQKEKCQKSLP